MLQALHELQAEAVKVFSEAKALTEVEAARVSFLGRKGRLADLMSQLPGLTPDERRTAGQMANEVKQAIEGAFQAAEARVKALEASLKGEKEWIDITLPGTKPQVGHVHMTTQAIEDLLAIFSRLGFNRQRHLEVDWDYFAFESLNMPKDHPARDEWETFFIADPEKDAVQVGDKGKVVLTPHTSNAQVREMQKGKVPIRMINISKCYRRQASARHLPVFHQLEGLMIDETTTITDLRGVIAAFVKGFFGEDTKTRLRPYHYRFTEPSFELDISCTVCSGEGFVNGSKCKLCKAGWLELGGAGMVHPNVLKAGGLDPKKYTGFAFGWGVERTAMMRGGLKMDDIRLMYRNDLRFLNQF